MKTYAVIIRATITKTILVDAEDEKEAAELAHQDFTVECEGDDENYEQETLSIKEEL